LEKERFISRKLNDLEEFFVNECEIETVTLIAISGLRKLALLSICGNKLREIIPRTIEKMNRLAYLILVDNLNEHLELESL
jgi:hypothetical protein